MAHYQTAIETKRPGARSWRHTAQTILNGGLLAAAVLFIAAVICGFLP